MRTHLILLLVCLSGSVHARGYADTLSTAIRINQLGFLPGGPKCAAVLADHSGDFFLVSADRRDTVYRGRLESPVPSPFSSLTTRKADFSAFHGSGVFRVSVPGIGYSYPFVVAEHVYAGLSVATLKAYYFNRCSTPLLPAFAGAWARAEGHPDTVVYVHASAAGPGRPEGSTLSAPGGWYDAGDYNKYVVNSGITVATLLSAYEDFPGYYDTLETHIPESRNGVPDILDEVRWNLTWMLAMQDADGGVYHKLTDSAFDRMEMPDRDHARRYVVAKSTAATLDFAAVMAQAGRVFAAFDRVFPGFADSCARAALRAWDWAQQHPQVVYDQQQLNTRFDPDISTGPYGDRWLSDEKAWAAAELYVSTGADSFYHAAGLPEVERMRVPTWYQVRCLGYYSLLRHRSRLHKVPATVFQVLQDRLLAWAEDLCKGREGRAFYTVMGHSAGDYVWGSNAVAANQGVAMIQAFLLSKDRRYLAAAVANLDYLCGRNATGYCYITGFGGRSPRHPHHRVSVADGLSAPVPGWLVAGPNPGQQDHSPTYPNRIPDQSYTDDERAYACNEVAINWNAPLVYLTGALEALQGPQRNRSALRSPAR